MLKRAIALSLSLAITPMVYGGATIDLRPTSGPPFDTSDSVDVDVYLVQDGGSNHALRMIQFHVDPTVADNASFAIPSPIPTTPSGQNFWDFSATNVCNPPDTTDCGTDHYIDGARNPVPLPSYGANILVVAFGSENELGPNLDKQFVLPGTGEVKVGTLRVVLPGADGRYTLDMVNAAETNPDKGAQVRWGFGTNINGEPLTTWRVSGGSPQLEGGTYEFCVGNPDPPCEPTCPVVANLASTDPAQDKSLWRTKKNVAQIDFDGAITAPAPGDILVQQLMDGGAFGPDLSASFTFTVVGGTTLKIDEPDPGVLSHQTWYAVRNTGSWACVAPFEVHYVDMVGDADNNNLINFTDVNLILGQNGQAVPPASPRRDIDGNDLINFTDVNLALNRNGTGAPPKPTGH